MASKKTPSDPTASRNSPSSPIAQKEPPGGSIDVVIFTSPSTEKDAKIREIVDDTIQTFKSPSGDVQDFFLDRMCRSVKLNKIVVDVSKDDSLAKKYQVIALPTVLVDYQKMLIGVPKKERLQNIIRTTFMNHVNAARKLRLMKKVSAKFFNPRECPKCGTTVPTSQDRCPMCLEHVPRE